MIRYSLTGYDSGLSPSNVGSLVSYDEAHAEIEQLEKEVERVKAEVMEARESLRLAVKSADLADAAIDTSWNNAIEAAAESASEWWAYLHDDQDRDGPVAAAIRALKRSQG